MASPLGQVFTVKPRQAESADARFDIRRHDPDQERKNKNHDDGEKKITFDTYDNAVVSVDALRAFLENFLNSLQKPDAQTNISLPENFTPPSGDETQAKHVDAQASRAANLYKYAAKTAPRTAPVAPSPQEPSGPDLGNEDVRAIHRLLADITILQSRKIEYLTIEKNETFLASLSAAVTKAKNS